MSRVGFIALLLAVVLPLSESRALDAKQVFETVAPSTVLVEDFDSQGSGVVLNDKGLILTNYHVVAANLRLKVRCRIKVGSKMVPTEIHDVTLVYVHRELDLAILQAKAPPNGVFMPARFVPKGLPVATGSKCFAIGNPGGPDGKALQLSITEGIVSASSRQIDGAEYVQFTAQINPGNSGGPVCDDQGRVFGIATWKMAQAEGLGFALPTSKVSMADFVQPNLRKPDPKVGAQAQEIGSRYNILADFAVGQERQDLLLSAASCFRVAMQAEPASPRPYVALAVVYQKLEDVESARKYLDAALKLAPNDSHACFLLGKMTIRGRESDPAIVNQCIQIWLRGLVNATESKSSANLCAESIAGVLQKQGKHLPSAYMLRWAEVIVAGADDVNQLRKREIWNALEGSLPEEQLEALRGRDTGFSQAEFASLLSGKPLANVAPPKPVIPSLTRQQMERIVSDAAKRFAPSQVDVPQEGLEIPLPETPDRAILAYAGWKMVISIPEIAKLAVLNLATAKVEGFIDCDDRRTLFAAGGQLLVTYSPLSEMFEVYDLATLKKVLSKKNPHAAPVSFIGMGLLNPSRLFTLHYEKSVHPFYQASFLAIPDLAPVLLRPTIKDGNNPLWNGFHPIPNGQMEGSMDLNGTVAAVRRLDSQPSGLGHYIATDTGRLRFLYQHENVPFPTVSDDGAYILTRGSVFNAGTKDDLYSTIGTINPYRLAAIAGYAGFVELLGSRTFHGFRLFGLPATTSLRTTPLAPEVYTRMTQPRSEDQKEIMLASAYCDRIAYTLPQSKSVMLFPLGLKGGSSGSDLAEPGKRFSRKLTVPTGSEVTVQSAPEGLRFDEKTGCLLWDVPLNFKSGQTVQVIMLVKPPGAKEEYAIERIAVP